MKHCNLNEELDDVLDSMFRLNSKIVCQLGSNVRLQSRCQIELFIFTNLDSHLASRLFNRLRRDIQLENKNN